MTGLFAGKVAIVTGAASGIGRASAQALARGGARVIGGDRATGTANEWRADLGGEGLLRPLDVTDNADWLDAVAEARARFGGLHILVHCAGAVRLAKHPQEPDVVSETVWRHMHAVNLDSLMLGVRAVIPAMRESGRGSIVAVSSLAGLRGRASSSAYASAKAAILQYVKTVAKQTGEQGWPIRCNAVVPGPINTPMMGSPGLAGGPNDPWVGEVPLGRYGAPEEVAAAIAFLASDEASYITGAGLPVDGGVSAAVAT